MTKQNRLTLINNNSTIVKSKPKAAPYAWKAKAIAGFKNIVLRPEDTWMIYQAQSYLGRTVTLSEAQELFSRIDIHTRQPIEPEKPVNWFMKLMLQLN